MTRLPGSVSRAEVIGWSIASPLVIVLAIVAYSSYGTVSSTMSQYRPIESELLTMTRFFGWLGDAGVSTVVLACAALPVAALLTRQKAWVYACSPIICGLLAFTFLHAMASALTSPSSALVRHYEQLTRNLAHASPPGQDK